MPLSQSHTHNKPLSRLRLPLASTQIDRALDRCLKLQRDAVTTHKKKPFAALLLDHDNCTVLLTHLSISHVQHAEAELARLASAHYSPEYLWYCTLVSTWEPCAMCTGTLYWANIGRLLFGASEKELRKITGDGHAGNMTMGLPCRQVLANGQKDVEVVGPVESWGKKVIEDGERYWMSHW